MASTNSGQKYKYQGQERQDELSLNWDSFKWRNYDFAIGRFMCIDPLAEKYAYNSTYAFQENKMGMGRELEGLELVPNNPIASFGGWISSKYDSAVNSMQKTISNVIKSISVGTTTEKASGAGKDGIAFSDGGNSQNPSALPEGGRDVMWFDFGGSLEVMTTVAAFELNVNRASVGKGTNGGKPTIQNKADDVITAIDNGVNGGNAIKDAVNENTKKDSKTAQDDYVTTYDSKTQMYSSTRKDVYEAQQKELKK